MIRALAEPVVTILTTGRGMGIDRKTVGKQTRSGTRAGKERAARPAVEPEARDRCLPVGEWRGWGGSRRKKGDGECRRTPGGRLRMAF